MMQKPEMNLPGEAMKWGRWYQSISDDTELRIAQEAGDSSSAGRQFRSRSDILAGQISGIQNVSTQQTFAVPPFFRSTPTGSGGLVFLVSPTYTFSPPRPTGSYRALVIATVRCTDTADISFSSAYVKVNGYVTQTQSATSNRVQSGTQNTMNVSLAGVADVVNGTPVSVEFAISGSDFSAHNVMFTDCQITVVYVGGL